MKKDFRKIISTVFYVIAAGCFLGAVTVSGSGFLDFSDIARLIYGSLMLICMTVATLIWKAKDARGKKKQLAAMFAAIVLIFGDRYIDSYMEQNSGTHEYTADMVRISEAVAARFETADGKSVIVESEIALLSSMAELELQRVPMTPADDPEDWIYRITFNPKEKVPNEEEIIVFVHETYLQIGNEYYLPIGDTEFDGILGMFESLAAYFVDSEKGEDIL